MATPPADSAQDAELINQIRKRLLETGDWERISSLLRKRLEESGWDDDIKDYAKERARAQPIPNLNNLLGEITPKAQSMVEPGIKEAVIAAIESVLEREVEKA